MALVYCGKESPTASKATSVLSINIKESPIVCTWNPGIEKWEIAFTIVFNESGGVRADASVIRSEALENNDIRDSFQVNYNLYEVSVPANGTLEHEWDFNVTGKDTFDTIKIIVFVQDANGGNLRLEEDFTDLSFVE